MVEVLPKSFESPLKIAVTECAEDESARGKRGHAVVESRRIERTGAVHERHGTRCARSAMVAVKVTG